MTLESDLFFRALYIYMCARTARHLGVEQWELFATLLLMRPYRGTVGYATRAGLLG